MKQTKTACAAMAVGQCYLMRSGTIRRITRVYDLHDNVPRSWSRVWWSNVPVPQDVSGGCGHAVGSCFIGNFLSAAVRMLTDEEITTLDRKEVKVGGNLYIVTIDELPGGSDLGRCRRWEIEIYPAGCGWGVLARTQLHNGSERQYAGGLSSSANENGISIIARALRHVAYSVTEGEYSDADDELGEVEEVV